MLFEEIRLPTKTRFSVPPEADQKQHICDFLATWFSSNAGNEWTI